MRFERLLNRIKVLTEELATSNLSRPEKIKILVFFGEFSEGIQRDLLEKHNLVEPFPSCLNCGEPLQAPFRTVEKEVTYKKCGMKMKVLYTLKGVEEAKLESSDQGVERASMVIRKEKERSPNHDRPLGEEVRTLDFIETLNSLIERGFLKVAKMERMPSGLVKKYYENTERFASG